MRSRGLEVAGICLLMIILGLLSTYPLIQHFDTAIPFGSYLDEINHWNRSGDHLQLLYWFWLVKENILGHIPYGTNPFEFIIPAHNTATGLITFPFALVFVLFSPLGDIPAYNCTIILSYLLTGTFTYLLVRIYRGNRTGALFAAVLFTLAPSRINGISGGNLYAHLFFCYPWVIYFLEKSLLTHRFRFSLLSALGIVFLSLLEAHLLYYLLLFLLVYLPFRFLLLHRQNPADIHTEPTPEARAAGMPVSGILLIIWCAGIATVLYSQIVITYRDTGHLFSPCAPWLFILYPLVLFLGIIWLALLLERLIPLTRRRCLILLGGAALPLYLLLPASILALAGIRISLSVLILTLLCIILIVEIVLLKKYLFPLLKTIIALFLHKWRALLQFLPLIAAILYTVILVPKSKTEKFAATVAEGGRTLADVQIYSADISDVFRQDSNVYLGILPAVIAAVFIVYLLHSLYTAKRVRPGHIPDRLTIHFYMLAALISYILALGLAFGNSSLYLLLYRYLPYFKYPRVSDRIMVMALFAAAVASGLLITALVRGCRKSGLRRILTIISAGAILFQLYDYGILKHPGITILDRGQTIYNYVSKNRDNGLLLELPLWPGDSHQSSLYEHYIMQDRIPRINGYSPLVKKEYVRTVFEPLFSLNRGTLDRRQFTLLHELNVRFLTLHDNEDVFRKKVSPFGSITTIRRLQNSPFLEQINTANKMLLKERDLQWDTLYLFRVKEKNELSESALQAVSAEYYEMPFLYDAEYRLSSVVGERLPDPKLGVNVFHAREGNDSAGYLVFGPYSSFAEENYSAFFAVRTKNDHPDDNGAATSIATLEVAKPVSEERQEILARKEIMDTEELTDYQQIRLDFSLNDFSRLEFRVYYHGTGEIWVDTVSVYKAGQHTPIYNMDADRMAGAVGQLEHLQDDTNKTVVNSIGVTIQEDGSQRSGPAEGDILYGPNRMLGKGNYTVNFSLRNADAGSPPSPDTAVILRVTDGRARRLFAQRQIKEDELQEEFAIYSLSFALERQEIVNLHVYNTGLTNVQADTVTITPAP